MEPCILKDINNLESVQRKLTKKFPRMRNLSYHQRLAKLKLESLELRQVRADILFTGTYKLVSDIINLKLSDFFISNFCRASRCHQYQLYLSGLLVKAASDSIAILIT